MRSAEEESRILILGASARAAAQSAVRAGFAPVCADMFADVDLCEVAEAVAVDDYPRGLIPAADRVPPGIWMYTGALENHPEIVSHVSQRHRLLGNPAEVIAEVRDPFRVRSVLSSGRVAALSVRPAGNPPPADGAWLRKPLRGAGGQRITVWDRQAQTKNGPHAGFFFQQRGDGESMSAIFLADVHQTRLIGVTKQLIGETRWNAPPFGYCGSIGPVALRKTIDRRLRGIGELLGDSFCLQGLFGVDFLLSNDAVLTTEINPRYTASVEVLEYATGQSLVAAHARACTSEPGRTAPDRLSSPSSVEIIGKAILFAAHDVTTPSLVSFREPISTAEPAVPAIADVPRAGTLIGRGDPICAVYSTGLTVGECTARLRRRADEVLRYVGFS